MSFLNQKRRARNFWNFRLKLVPETPQRWNGKKNKFGFKVKTLNYSKKSWECHMKTEDQQFLCKSHEGKILKSSEFKLTKRLIALNFRSAESNIASKILMSIPRSDIQKISTSSNLFYFQEPFRKVCLTEGLLKAFLYLKVSFSIVFCLLCICIEFWSLCICLRYFERSLKVKKNSNFRFL